MEENFTVIHHTKFHFPNKECASAWHSFLQKVTTIRQVDNKCAYVIDPSNTYGHIVAAYNYDNVFGGMIEFADKEQ